MELTAAEHYRAARALRASGDSELAARIEAEALEAEVRAIIGAIDKNVAASVTDTLESVQEVGCGMARAMGHLIVLLDTALHGGDIEGSPVTTAAREMLLAWAAMDASLTSLLKSVRARE